MSKDIGNTLSKDMGNTFLQEEEGAHAMERCYRERADENGFLQDYQLNFYSLSELAERFNISRKTAYKWIDRFTDYGKTGLSRTVPAAASLSLADRGIRDRGGAG